MQQDLDARMSSETFIDHTETLQLLECPSMRNCQIELCHDTALTCNARQLLEGKMGRK